MDITSLILEDHHEQRRMFAILDDVDRDDTQTLSAVWRRLCILLEVHAVAEAARHDVGSEGWWKGVARTRAANSDHMGEEERQALADFRRHADLATRQELGVAFAAYEARHADGVTSRNRDPDEYIARHR